MLAAHTPVRGTPRRDTDVKPATPGSPVPPERLWPYLRVMRSGAFERHLATCPDCTAAATPGVFGGPCGEGITLARAADEATEQAIAHDQPFTPARARRRPGR